MSAGRLARRDGSLVAVLRPQPHAVSGIMAHAHEHGVASDFTQELRERGPRTFIGFASSDGRVLVPRAPDVLAGELGGAGALERWLDPVYDEKGPCIEGDSLVNYNQLCANAGQTILVGTLFRWDKRAPS